LDKHQAASKVEFKAARPLAEPIEETSTIATLDNKIVGKEFKKDQSLVKGFFENADEETRASLMAKFEEGKTCTIEVDGKEFVLNEKHIAFKKETKTLREEKYTPWVIEPAFGIGRIVYCIFEHAFKERERPADFKKGDSERHYFDFSPLVAPLKCVVLPLINHAGLNAKTAELKKILVRAGVSSKVDDSGVSVGKRYARTDECGIPFALTVDFTTLEDSSVTIRILDQMTQVRIPMSEVVSTVTSLTQNNMTW
jgi:glycyl-tRNA synthetase